MLGFEHTKVTAKDENGNDYLTGETGPQVMSLRCDCGHEFKLEKRMFPGRRNMRNCGRVGECEYADGKKLNPKAEEQAREARAAQIDAQRDQKRKAAERRITELQEATRVATSRLPGRPRSSNLPGRNITIYLTGDEYEMVLEFARKDGMSTSRACGALIQAGYQRLTEQAELLAQAAIEDEQNNQNTQPTIPNGSGKRGKKLRLNSTPEASGS